MNWNKLENFFETSGLGGEIIARTYARSEGFCLSFDLKATISTKNEVDGVDVTVEVYTEPTVRLTEDRKKAIDDKARGIALDLIDRFCVDGDVIGLNIAIKFLIDTDEYENDKMFALCSSRSWKAIDY